MSVRAGGEFLAVPGPATIPDEVLQAMQRPAVEIYSKPLIALTDSLLRGLGRLFATQGRSDTVTTVLTGEGLNPNVLRDYCDSKCGVVLGRGRGPACRETCSNGSTTQGR